MKLIHAGAVAVLALTLALSSGAVLAHNGEEHGNHDAHHGGFVMMYKDVHCEIVLPTQGGVQIYYTDAQRRDLPASIASDVSVELERGDKKTETLAMVVSASGDFWEGKASPLTDTKGIVHLAFVLQGEPVVVELPVSALRSAKPAAPASKSPAAKPAADKKADHTAMDHSAMSHHAE